MGSRTSSTRNAHSSAGTAATAPGDVEDGRIGKIRAVPELSPESNSSRTSVLPAYCGPTSAR